MKFTLPKTIISEITSKMGRLLTAKSSIPILMGTLVEAKNDCILFTASDGTESMIHRVNVTEENGVRVEEEGKSVFSKETLEVAKKMKGEITFDANESCVTVSQDKTSLEFSVALASDYPAITVENTANPLTFKGKEFETLVKKTAYAVATNDTRPVLTGVNMTFGATNNFVATDSHRLAQYKSGISDQEIQITVPASILEHALKSFDLTQNIMIFPSQNQIALANGSTVLISRLLEGNYPDTARLVPPEFNHELIVNKDEFMATLDLLSILEDKSVVQLTINGLSVELSSKGATSKGKKELFYESYEGEEGFKISFSAKYTLEALRTINTASVRLSFVENMRPYVITPVTNEPTTELQLILPVRTM